MSASPQETCWTLIRGAAAGRAVEREEFTRRYLPTVRTYLAARFRQTPMAHELDDAVQEVFVTCFRADGILDGADPARGFRGFLYGVARNVARNLERSRLRRARNLPEADLSPEVVPAADQALSTIFDREYARSIMRQAAETMADRARGQGSERQRRVELLRLRFEEGLAIREIARLWQADAADLHRQYAKAGREFKAALRDVVGLAERCAPDRLQAECDRLLQMLQ